VAGIGTRLLKTTISGTERNAECATAELTSAESDSDFVTFADAAAGGARQYKLHIVAVQDAAVGTLWDLVWSSAGSSVACLLKPYGNTTASAAQPHYSFNAIVTEPDGTFLGGEADKSTTARMTFEAEWPLDAKPTKVTS
jgi:hypothetical protein